MKSCTKAKKFFHIFSMSYFTFPLFIQRLHQTEIKRKLEEFARRERIHKMKVCLFIELLSDSKWLW